MPDEQPTTSTQPVLGVFGIGASPGEDGFAAELSRALEEHGFGVARLISITDAVASAAEGALSGVVLSGLDEASREALFNEFFASWFPDVPLVRVCRDLSERTTVPPLGPRLPELPWPIPEGSATLAWLKSGQAATEVMPAARLRGLRALAEASGPVYGELNGEELSLLGRILDALQASEGERFEGGLDEATLPLPELQTSTVLEAPVFDDPRAMATALGALLFGDMLFGDLDLVAALPDGGLDAGASLISRFDEATLPTPLGGSALEAFGGPLLSRLALYTDPRSRVERAVSRLQAQDRHHAEPVGTLLGRDGPSLARALWARLPAPPTVLLAAPHNAGQQEVAGVLLASHLRVEWVETFAAAVAAAQARPFDVVLVDDGLLLGPPAQGELERAAAPAGVVVHREGASLADVVADVRFLLAAPRERATEVRIEAYLSFFSAPEEGPVLLGALGDALVPELLLSLYLAGRTALLEVYSPGERVGVVEVVGGQIVFAASADAGPGDLAVRRLSCLDQGWFRVSYGPRPPRPPNVGQPTPSLLVEALRTAEP